MATLAERLAIRLEILHSSPLHPRRTWLKRAWMMPPLTALPATELHAAQSAEGLLAAPDPEEYTSVVARIFMPAIAR